MTEHPSQGAPGAPDAAGAGTPYPAPGAPQSTPGTPAPGPAYGQPGPVYGQPAPAYGRPQPASPFPGAPAYGQQPPGQFPPGQGAPWGPPVHKPGIVPLRPLVLGGMFGGALQTIRRNPKATVGMALLVSFAFMLLPILGTIVLGASDLLPSMDATSGSPGLSDVSYWVSTLVTAVFSGLSTIVITGLIVRVVEQAVLGRRMSAGEAWEATSGRLLPLLGLTLLTALGALLVIGVPVGVALALGLLVGNTVLTVLLVVLAGLAALVAVVFLYTRYVLLSTPTLVLENTGVIDSLRRGAVLSRGQFWRIFGIYLLATVAASFAAQVIAIPFSILGAVSLFVLPSSWSMAGMMLASNVSSILTGALIGPFTSGVLVLQYFDQRFRKEGLDIELMDRTLGAGNAGQPR